VRCGCGFSERCFKPRGLPLRNEWIIERVHGVRFITPSLYDYYNERTKGFIVKKDEFIKYLVNKAEKGGVVFHPGERIISVNEEVSGNYELRSEKGTYSSRILVDCSGFNSPVRRFLGLGKIPTMGAVRYLFRKKEFDIERFGVVRTPGKRYINFIFHPFYFPGGYGWIFPMGKMVQVGAACTNNPALALDRYLSDAGIGAGRPGDVVGGRIPFMGPERKLVYDRVLLIGESASLVNPMNLAGNYGAMLSASLAAEAVTQYFNSNEKDNVSLSGVLHGYEEKLLGHPSQSIRLGEGAGALRSLSGKALDTLGKCSIKEGEGGLSTGRMILKLLFAPSLYPEILRLVKLNRSMPFLWEHGW